MPYPERELQKEVVYYGSSDLIGQIASELATNPEGCFAKNVCAWYDALYSAESEGERCSYQVEINQELCECDPGDTIEDAVDLLGAIVEGKTRRAASLTIRIACREALRNVTRNTSQGVT